MNPLDILILFNEPNLPPDDPDRAQEAGVLESVDAVSAALASAGHTIRRHGAARVEDLEIVLDRLFDSPAPDLVFNLFEGFDGVGRGEAEVAGLVELAGHALSGSPPECLALARDKARAKWLLAGAGLPTAPFLLIAPDAPLESRLLADFVAAGPAIVKPAHEDGSLGIGPESIVHDARSMERQVEAIRARYGAVLVERFIVGREFNAAVIALPEAELLPLAEIEFSGPEPPGWQIVTYEAKWAAGSAADCSTPARCPAKVNEPLAREISRVALAAFRLTGCRDYARVDLRVDAAGSVNVLEVNANPDIGPSAGFARALAAAGIAYEQFVERLVQTAAARRVPAH